MTNEQTIDEIMVQAGDHARAWADSQTSEIGYRGTAYAYLAEEKAALRHAITAALAAKDDAMAIMEAESVAMSDALRQIAESMGLGVGHTAAEIVAALKQRLTDSGSDLQALKDSPAPGEWIEWNGVECPIADGVLHEVRLKDGRNLLSLNAGAWVWIHRGEGFDIVAYKVLA